VQKKNNPCHKSERVYLVGLTETCRALAAVGAAQICKARARYT
jgi:hypothetical protein